MLSCNGIHHDSDAPPQPVESNSENSTGESQDKDKNIEYDSDESIENGGMRMRQGSTAMMSHS